MKQFSSFLMAAWLCILAMTSCSAAQVPGSDSRPETGRLASVSAQAVSFSDVSADAWYFDAVDYCRRHGVMSGTSAGAFAPEAALTRGMLAAILYRMSGTPAVSDPPVFADAAAGSWYGDAVSWAAKSRLISGYGGGIFGAGDPATREQAVTILWRYAGSPESSAAERISDAAEVSAWAQKALRWAGANGILEGMTEGGRFDPKANLKRGEAASMLYHYFMAEATEPQRKITLSAVGRSFEAVLYDTPAADALWERLPMTVTMQELNGNEKYCDLPDALPTDAASPEEIQAGDLMLFGASCLVLFYQSFPTSYSYTPLGRLTDPSGLAQALGSGSAEITFARQEAGDPAGKTLVAYFSATGATRPLAEYAAEIMGADLYEIVPEVPYTDADLAYYTNGRAGREQSDPAARPGISGGVTVMSGYDVVFLGYPIWHGKAPRIVSTFLERYDFTGKTIVPFCTSHSSGIGSSDTDLHPLASGANWLAGRRFAGGTARDAMEEWISGLELPKPPASSRAEFNP